MPVAGYWTLAKKGEVNKIMMKKCITEYVICILKCVLDWTVFTNFLTFEYAYCPYYILLNNNMACLLASIFFATLFHVRLKIIGHVSTS